MTTPTVLTVEQAEALAQRTLAAIDALDYSRLRADIDAADRERVASDLAGLRQHHGPALCPTCSNDHGAWPCPDARRYTAGLLRTAALYGQKP